MAEYKIDTSELREYCGRLRAGDRVLLSGTVYTSRDAAHKRICALLDSGEELPFDLKDAAIYYAGPTPTKPGDVIGSCGPTTSRHGCLCAEASRRGTLLHDRKRRQERIGYRCDKAQQCRISLRDRRRRRACFKVHNKMRGDSVF